MPEREQGGIDSRQWPKTAADLAEQEREALERRRGEPVAQVDAIGNLEVHRNAVCVSITIDAVGAAEAYGFNGRETAAWVLGQWQRHYRAAVDDGFDFEAEDAWFELRAEIRGDHLPAVAAIMLRSGVSADVASSSGDLLTLRLQFRR